MKCLGDSDLIKVFLSRKLFKFGDDFEKFIQNIKQFFQQSTFTLITSNLMACLLNTISSNNP